MGTLATTGNFPYTIPPLSNITAFTYRDGITYTELLYALRDYIVDTLEPEREAQIATLIEQINAGLAGTGQTIIDSKAEWQAAFDTFMADVTAQLAALNDTAVGNLIDDSGSAVGVKLRALVNLMAISPDEVDAAVAAQITATGATGTKDALTAFVDSRNTATRDTAVAALLNNTATVTGTALQVAIDARNTTTRDAAVAALLGTASGTRTAVDARVTATADAVVGANVSLPASKTGAAVGAVIDVRPVHAGGTQHVDIGLVRRQMSTARYSAFPVTAKLNDGRLFSVWYEADDHIGARNGIVKGAYSTDNGSTWGARFTVYSIAGKDLRDPTVSTSRDGKTLYLTYINCTAATPRDGYYLMKSTDNGATWSAPVRIDPAGSNGAGTAPVLELSNGKLFATWYGSLTGEAFDSVYCATSTDGGTTWGVPVKLRNGVTDGIHYNEPVAALQGDTIVVLYRWGASDGIGRLVSGDNGASWSVPNRMFTGSGRPYCIITKGGALVVVYRNIDSGTITTQHGMMRVSRDLGASWTQPRLVEPAVGGWWVYGGLLEVVPGQILCGNAIELSGTSTEISFRYLTEGAGISPFGDTTESAYSRAVSRRTSLAAVDTFDRPNGPIDRTGNGLPWNTSVGGASVVDGAIQNDGSGVAGLHTVNLRTANVDVSCEMKWDNGAGCYIVFRFVDGQNYWFAGTESAGTVMRVYKVENNVVTQTDSVALSFPEGVWHTLRVTNLGGTIRVYLDGGQVIASVQTAGPNGNWVGLRLGAAGNPSYVHRVRNFLAHRRSGFAN